MSSSDSKVVIITGGSAGIGRETALLLARNNFKTYASMRDLQKSSELKSIAEKEKLDMHFVQLDVTNDNSIKNAVQKVYDEAGRIDILVNNAGYALSGAFEDLSIYEIKEQYETNVYGLIKTTQAVLPIMRRQRSGVVVNISSGAGRFGYPTGSAYVSTKFAVEGLSESMSYELEPFGIRTVIIEPGVIDTDFHNASKIAKKSQDPDSPYVPLMKTMESNVKKMIANGSTPQYVAEVILEAITSPDPKLRYIAGKDVEQWMEAKRKMSDDEYINMMKQFF
ncbi:MAG TPA: SDR family oxidoreductase [Nitrososphaeraceae archaeon]|nr:SDR family oxidoreductase [Nitrososphaeraceae archaeon]